MVLIFHEFKYVLRLCDMFRFVAFRQQTQNQRMEKEDGGGGSPDAKRKRGFTRRETVEKLKELVGNVFAAVCENIDPN